MVPIKNALKLFASPGAVIANYLHLPGGNRLENIVARVRKLPDEEAILLKDVLFGEFGNRHRDIQHIFSAHFDRVNAQLNNELSVLNPDKKILLGAFVTKEYSIQSAALFNPSIVPHPDQTNLQREEQRFVMSLRATGEGHISSIVFKTGVVDSSMNIMLDEPALYSTCLLKNDNATYQKDFVQQRLSRFNWFNPEFLNLLPETFTANEALHIVKNNSYYSGQDLNQFCKYLAEILDSNYELQSSSHLPLNEKVMFPTSHAESMGMEDVRFVKFKDGLQECYYGTYTAYNGKSIQTQLIETKDFDVFKIRTLYGNAISDKGMALFPEKVNDKFVMVSRQGAEMINIMYSDNLYNWDTYELLMEPYYSWELVQLGNCGSPIKTSAGWLLLTHGVGIMRTYVISAILLDLKNPSVIIGRLNTPLIKADETEREGYVPNVVYTCGFMQHGNMLLIPYAVSDSATGFVTVKLDDLLDQLKSNQQL